MAKPNVTCSKVMQTHPKHEAKGVHTGIEHCVSVSACWRSEPRQDTPSRYLESTGIPVHYRTLCQM